MGGSVGSGGGEDGLDRAEGWMGAAQGGVIVDGFDRWGSLLKLLWDAVWLVPFPDVLAPYKSRCERTRRRVRLQHYRPAITAGDRARMIVEDR